MRPMINGTGPIQIEPERSTITIAYKDEAVTDAVLQKPGPVPWPSYPAGPCSTSLELKGANARMASDRMAEYPYGVSDQHIATY